MAKSPRVTIAHRIGWLRVFERSFGHKSSYLMAIDNERIKGIFPMVCIKGILRRKLFISLPWIDYGGICADSQEIEELLLTKAIEFVKKENAQFLEMRSVNGSGLGLKTKEDKVTFILPLTPNPEEIWKSFKAKVRNQVRKAVKSGLKVDIGGETHLKHFYRVFGENMRDLGTPVWGYSLFKNIIQEFPLDTKVILVKLGKKVVGGALMLLWKDRVYIPSASSLRSYFRYCPNDLLYWEAIKYGCENGFKYFDFGRSSWDSGTFKFKKQWGGEIKQLHWQYYLNSIDEIPSLNPSNPKYKMAIKLWRKLPLSVANHFGPKIVKHFP